MPSKTVYVQGHWRRPPHKSASGGTVNRAMVASLPCVLVP